LFLFFYSAISYLLLTVLNGVVAKNEAKI
jgi:hypothetical protein